MVHESISASHRPRVGGGHDLTATVALAHKILFGFPPRETFFRLLAQIDQVLDGSTLFNDLRSMIFIQRSLFAARLHGWHWIRDRFAAWTAASEGDLRQLVAVNHRLHRRGSVVGLNYCNYSTRKLMLALVRTRTGAQRYSYSYSMNPHDASSTSTALKG